MRPTLSVERVLHTLVQCSMHGYHNILISTPEEIGGQLTQDGRSPQFHLPFPWFSITFFMYSKSLCKYCPDFNEFIQQWMNKVSYTHSLPQIAIVCSLANL